MPRDSPEALSYYNLYWRDSSRLWGVQKSCTLLHRALIIQGLCELPVNNFMPSMNACTILKCHMTHLKRSPTTTFTGEGVAGSERSKIIGLVAVPCPINAIATNSIRDR